MTAPPWLDDGDVKIWHGTATEALRNLPDRSAQTCITSPPFWGLRDYGTGTWTGGTDDCDHLGPPMRTKASLADSVHSTRGSTSHVDREPFKATCGKCGAQRVDQQIGLEPTPDEWCARLVDVFREVRRVLRDDGTLWLEVGDSYAAGKSGRTDHGSGDPTSRLGPDRDGLPNGAPPGPVAIRTPPPGLKPKDLVGAPWMLAFALRADGWYLRADVIWARPNPMPESVTDRPTKAHSYVFLLTKRPRYYYDADAIREPHTAPERNGKRNTGWDFGDYNAGNSEHVLDFHPAGRNARSVWNIATEPTPFAHFATFPQALVERCILAGTSERGQCPSCGTPWARQVERERLVDGQPAPSSESWPVDHGRRLGPEGIGHYRVSVASTTTGWAPTCQCTLRFEPVPQTVLDPFMGSATTALVARRLGRHATGTELSAEYLAIAARRLQQLSLLGEVYAP